MYVQSNQKDSEYIIARMENFIKTIMAPMFEGLNNEVFNTTANGVLVSKKEIDASMRHRFVRLLLEVSTHRYVFDRNEQEAAILEDWIAREDKADLILSLQKLFDELFVKGKKILTVTYTCTNHLEVAKESQKIASEALGQGVERVYAD